MATVHTPQTLSSANNDFALIQRLQTIRTAPNSRRLLERLFDELLPHYQRQISRMAQHARTESPDAERDDFFNAGRLGLFKALEDFAPNKKVPFAAYAIQCIRYEIKRCQEETGRLIQRPRPARRQLRSIAQATQELASELKRPPTTGELARSLAIPEKQLQAFLARMSHTASVGSLDRPEVANQLAAPTPSETPLVERAERLWSDFGYADGEVFRWAALLAPLPLAQRGPALRRFWSRSPTAGWCRCEGVWEALGWAAWLQQQDPPLTEPVVRRLLEDLQSRNLFRREHAAFAIWVMHAVPHVRSRCTETALQRLSEALLQSTLCLRDLGVRDATLYMLTVKLFDRNRPDLFALGLDQPAFYRHVVRNDATSTADITSAIGNSMPRLEQGQDQENLYLLWDGAGIVGKRLVHANALHTELPAKWRRRWGYLRAANAARDQNEEAISRFLEALRENGETRLVRENPRNLAVILEDLLSQHGSAQLPSLLLRRTAAAMIRFVEPAERDRLSKIALSDPSIFVRFSVVSSLRDAALRGERVAYRHLCDQLDQHIGNTHRPIEIIANLLHVLVLYAFHFDPERRQEYKEILGYCQCLSQDPNPELRGKALAWVGHLQRHRPQAPQDDTVCLELLKGRKHEYAVNIAQALAAPMGFARQPRLPDDYGVRPKYSVPLWRSDWR